NIVVTFSEFIDPGTGQDNFSYSVPGFNIVSAVVNADGKSVTVTVDGSFTPGGSYTIFVQGVQDLAGNVISPNPCTLNFTAPVISCGFLVFETYNTPDCGTAVSALISSPDFPNHPRETFYIGAADTRLAPPYANDSHERYGGRL